MHIIILPGWQHTSTHWETVSSLLKGSSLKVSVIDFPGFGIESAQGDIQTLEDAVDWVDTKIISLSLSEPILLVGHSFGGRIAVTLAARQANTIAQLILIGSPNLYHADIKTRLLSVSSKFLSPLKAVVPEQIKSLLRSSDFSHIRGSGMQNLFTCIIGLNQTTDLQKISIPVHLIWGEKDVQVPLRVATDMISLLKNAELDIIQGTGHDIHLEKPQLLAGQIQKYAKTS